MIKLGWFGDDNPKPEPESQTYCAYNVIRGFAGSGLGTGDVLCVDCPKNGVCPGSDSSDSSIAIEEKSTGNIYEGMVRLEIGHTGCRNCPSGSGQPEGKKGYKFA